MENEENELQPPPGTKRNMRLRIFKSFEEAAAAEAQDNALQQPVERIRETVELTLRVYGVTRGQLMARDKKLHINIIRRK